MAALFGDDVVVPTSQAKAKPGHTAEIDLIEHGVSRTQNHFGAS